MERYHMLSDATMDGLLHALENLMDILVNPAYEVEYHVSCFRAELHILHSYRAVF